MIRVRPTNEGDELVLQELLGQLGYGLTIEEVRTRLALLATSRTDPGVTDRVLPGTDIETLIEAVLTNGLRAIV